MKTLPAPMPADYRAAFEAGANDERIRIVAKLREMAADFSGKIEGTIVGSVVDAALKVRLQELAIFFERGGHEK